MEKQHAASLPASACFIIGGGGGEKKKQPLFKKSLIFGLAGDLQAVAGLIKLFFNEAHEM